MLGSNIRLSKASMHGKKRIIVFAVIGLLAMMRVVAATSDMNPRITYTGNGVPDPSVGRIGDIYIDMDTNVLYVFGSSGWGVFAVLPTPINGTNGLNGATWIVGDTDPAADLGSNGDLYFNYASLDIFYKANDVWSLLANIAPLQGPQGETGPQGPTGADGINGTDGVDGTNGTNGVDGRNGSTWYNELLVPMTPSLGSDGDYYMFTNGAVYYKMSGSWVYFTSLMGPAGPQGETGPTGQDGINGTNGTDGINGTNGTDGIDGTDGQTGPMGPQGPQGEMGPVGPVGPAGPQGETGVTGASGTTGAQGVAGIDGSDGVDGSTGAKGTDAPWWIYIVLSAIGGGAVGSVTVLVAKRKVPK